MKFVIAPDSFKESMSAAEAARAIERGVRRVLPEAECQLVPMADGGEGTVETLRASLGGERRRVRTQDALGRPIEAEYLLVEPDLAVIEVATVVGIGLIEPGERDVLQASSQGVGDLLLDALEQGASRLIVGLGGSATTDGGAGMLQRLGAVLVADDGTHLRPTPAGLCRLDRVDLAGLDPRLALLRIEVASDVTNPLLGPAGAAAVFGPQKGASVDQVPILEAALTRLADALERAGLPEVRSQPGAGAAGGLGAAFLELGAGMRRGVQLVAEAVGLAGHLKGADLVLTGEGAIDAQTGSGKTPAGVAELAARHGVPVIAFAGQVAPAAGSLLEQGFAAIVPIMRGPAELPTALAEGPRNLEAAVATTLRAYLLGRRNAQR